jgi:RNA polymerase sigma factor (sigma-70 family)
LHEAVNKLPEKSKEVITIYFFEEFDQKEAAEKLGITQGAFSKRLSKALEQLKSMLGEDFLFD